MSSAARVSSKRPTVASKRTRDDAEAAPAKDYNFCRIKVREDLCDIYTLDETFKSDLVEADLESILKVCCSGSDDELSTLFMEECVSSDLPDICDRIRAALTNEMRVVVRAILHKATKDATAVYAIEFTPEGAKASNKKGQHFVTYLQMYCAMVKNSYHRASNFAISFVSKRPAIVL
jgi:hypothetical protein